MEQGRKWSERGKGGGRAGRGGEEEGGGRKGERRKEWGGGAGEGWREGGREGKGGNWGENEGKGGGEAATVEGRVVVSSTGWEVRATVVRRGEMVKEGCGERGKKVCIFVVLYDVFL